MEKEEHLMNLLKWIKAEVLSSGGDGDAFFYTRYHSLSYLYQLIQEIEKNEKFPWSVKLENDEISWGDNQEWVLITTSEEKFKAIPSWAQLVIRN
jgi:hypothetical protein